MPRAYVRRPRAGRAVRCRAGTAAGDGVPWRRPAGDGRQGLSVAAPTVPPMVAALSPSRASDFMQCPLLYRFRVIDKLPQAPSAAAARGTLVHSVLERVFDLPAAGRTLDAAAAMVAPQWAALLEAEPELAALVDSDDPEALALWVKDAVALVERWFSLEDPTRLEPAERELYVETDLDGLTLRGYVDRLDVAPTGEIRVVDYKTGRSPSELFEGKALFQMKFYALVLWRLHGTVPRMLQLVYLGNSEIVALLPGRGRPAGHRAQAQGVVAGHRARGHHRRLAPPHQPAVRLVRPPGPLPGLGRHSPGAARGRRAPCPQPALLSGDRPQRGLSAGQPLWVDGASPPDPALVGCARCWIGTAPVECLRPRRCRLARPADLRPLPAHHGLPPPSALACSSPSPALASRQRSEGPASHSRQCLRIRLPLNTIGPVDDLPRGVDPAGRIVRMFESSVDEVAAADVAGLAAALLGLSARGGAGWGPGLGAGGGRGDPAGAERRSRRCRCWGSRRGRGAPVRTSPRTGRPGVRRIRGGPIPGRGMSTR